MFVAMVTELVILWLIIVEYESKCPAQYLRIVAPQGRAGCYSENSTMLDIWAGRGRVPFLKHEAPATFLLSVFTLQMLVIYLLALGYFLDQKKTKLFKTEGKVSGDHPGGGPGSA